MPSHIKVSAQQIVTIVACKELSEERDPWESKNPQASPN